MAKKRLIFFHFKRDLRLFDNSGLYQALRRAYELTQQGFPTEVLPVFVFDRKILDRLPSREDRRVSFIFYHVLALQKGLQKWGSDLLILHGSATEELIQCRSRYQSEYGKIDFYGNFDDDPYPRMRDQKIKDEFTKEGGQFCLFKDHHLFSRSEILNRSQSPYTVFTSYKKSWLEKISDPFYLQSYPTEKYKDFLKKGFLSQKSFSLEEIGFQRMDFPSQRESSSLLSVLSDYAHDRDFPSRQGTSLLGVHLRFGTISVRQLVSTALEISESFVSELIWRDFFAQILYHYPRVVKESFKVKYENISWRYNEEEIQRWKEGSTGYPLVDAGMRELVQTGYMHNRVRMVVGSFFCKHLLHHWHVGERWFANHLLDYDLASNNGNWQWVAGSGCDAAPYFRIFNPMAQQEKFDADFIYIKKWVPEFETSRYPPPMVNHEQARQRALNEYRKGLER